MATVTETTPLQKVFDVTLGLLADEEAWIRYHYAEDAEGESIDPDDPAACRWCLRGALNCAVKLVLPNEDEDDQYMLNARAYVVLSRVVGAQSRVGPMTFNDDRLTTHEDVIRVLTLSRNEA